MKNPLITMSAITGKPAECEIVAYMNSLHENGIEQILLYPRSGCELEYLSEEWFDTIGKFLKTAKKLDMDVWLYDEFNWPSGDAGGKVSSNKKMRLRSVDKKGVISSYSQHNKNLFGEKFFPDLLSDEAVDLFIELTYEEYYKRFKDYFGNVIKGFFTDEPSIGYCSSDKSVPYYDGLFDDYEKYYGKSFFDGCAEFYKNVTRLVFERFNNCFILKLKNWCESHGILLTGHLMGDTEPYGATLNSGDYLKSISRFSLPGVDEIATGISSSYTLSIFGNAEYAANENGAMAELFALGPCDISYKTRRCMIYLASCFKINHYFLAVSPMDMRGNMKIRDYFNIFSEDQPDFCGIKLLSEDAKTAASLAKKDFDADVYIKYPTEVCAQRICEKIDTSEFVKLLGKLTENQIQWKYCDDCNYSPLIEFDEDFQCTLNGIRMSHENICSTLNKETMLTDKNGASPQGIFVREFCDGTVAVINRNGESGVYLLDGKEIYLEKEDVYISGDDVAEFVREAEINVLYSVNFKNDNLIRLMYINSQKETTVTAAEDVEVRLFVRDGVSVKLDGLPVYTCEESRNLPNGLKPFYNSSKKIMLKKGTHTVTAGEDFKYMPSVFVSGDFCVETHCDEVILSERKKECVSGERIEDYGVVELEAEATVPESATAIRLFGTSLYTEVFIDGETIGERIYSPYVYPIEESFRGKRIKLRIVQRSSIAPIFGDVGYYDKKSDGIGCRGTPSPKATLFGFDKICWSI